MKFCEAQRKVQRFGIDQDREARHEYFEMLRDERVQAVLDEAEAALGEPRRTLLYRDALALCGSPYYVLSHNRWAEAAWEFLALFCD